MTKILIIKANFVYTEKPEEYTIKEKSYLVIEDGLVKDFYTSLPVIYDNCEIIDYGDSIVIPGFIDLHLHGGQYLQRGMGMTKELLEWLNDYTYILEAKFKDREFAEAVYSRFVKELARVGTTRCCVYSSSSLVGTEVLIEAFKEQGLYAYVGKVDMDVNAPEYITVDCKTSLEETEYLLKKYEDEDRVRPIITPRFAPTSSREQLQGLGDLASKYNSKVQSHISESTKEVEWVSNLFPERSSYTDVYDYYNLLKANDTLMAHAIYLDDDEIEIMKKKDIRIVHCPDSNINVRSGIMPIKKYMEEGLKLGLGTDIAGGHKIAMNEAIVRAVQLSKIDSVINSKDEHLSITEAFYLATKGGGEYFGKVGSFEKGYEFDALVIGCDSLMEDLYLVSDRLEKFLYTGDDRFIKEVYVRGDKIKR